MQKERDSTNNAALEADRSVHSENQGATGKLFRERIRKEKSDLNEDVRKVFNKIL